MNENNVRYVVEVRATRDGTTGPVARTTGIDRDRLRAPANFTAVMNRGTVTMSWDRTDDDSITGYQYRYYSMLDSVATQDATPWSDVRSSSWRTTSATVRDPNLDVGDPWGFEVRAKRGAEEGPAASDYYFP